MADVARPSQGATSRRFGTSAYKWRALSCTSVGMLMAALNSGTLVIALPDLQRQTHAGLLTLVWMILVYMIVSTVLVLNAGRLSDIFGRKRLYVIGFAVFTAASFGAGFTPGAAELIAWRALQGAASAFVIGNAAAIVADAFPKKELGLAMGVNSMVAAVGTVLGPVVGGLLVAISWRWVFWFNVPVGIAGTTWAAVVLRDMGRRDSERGLDPGGALLYLFGLGGLVLALSAGGLEGWTSPLVVTGLALAVSLLPLFVLVERRVRVPMLDLEIFRDRLFRAAAAASLLNGLARFALSFLMVIYLEGPQRLDPIGAGIRLAPFALGTLIASPIAGRISDAKGSRVLAAIGMALTAAGLASMTTLDARTPYWHLAGLLAVVGVGSGVFNSPNTAAMMQSVSAERRGVAAGVRMMLQTTGSVISISFVVAIVTVGIPHRTLFAIFSGLTVGLPSSQVELFMANLHHAVLALAALALIGMVVSLLRPSHDGRAAERLDAQAYG